MLFLFPHVKYLRKKIAHLEEKVETLEKKLTESLSIINNNLIRIKNNYETNDQAIYHLTPYIDLSAFRAYELFQTENLPYTILDIESDDYERPVKLENIIKIPFADLENRLDQLPPATVPLFILSQNGVRSIDACHLLIKHGFHNCYNISGGYEKWPDPKIHGLGQTLD